MNEKRCRLPLQSRNRRSHQKQFKNERRRRNREVSAAIKALKQSVPAFAIRRQQHLSVILPQDSGKSEYGIFQQRSRCSSDSRYRPGRRSRNLGCREPHGGLRQRQPRCQEPGHEAAHGGRRRGAHRHDPRPPAYRSFRLIAAQQDRSE